MAGGHADIRVRLDVVEAVRVKCVSRRENNLIKGLLDDAWTLIHRYFHSFLETVRDILSAANLFL